MNEQPSGQGSFRIRSHVDRSSSDCRMVSDAIDEYALGIIEPAQRAAVDRHLIRCTECSALVASFQATTAVLALAAPLAVPSASARTALFDRIAQTPQTMAPARTIYTGPLDALRTPTLPASDLMPAMPVAPQEQSPWWRVYAAPLATLPLLLALGLMAAWGLNSYTQLNDSQSELAQRDLQIARLSSQLSTDNSDGVTKLAFSSTAKRYALTPEVTGVGSLAQGTLFADSATDEAALQVTGLPAGTYSVVVQLQNGDMVPKTEFVVNAEGSASTMLSLGDTQVTDLRSVHIRPTTTVTETDVAAIQSQPDSLMTLIGPDISDDSDTSVQKP